MRAPRPSRPPATSVCGRGLPAGEPPQAAHGRRQHQAPGSRPERHRTQAPGGRAAGAPGQGTAARAGRSGSARESAPVPAGARAARGRPCREPCRCRCEGGEQPSRPGGQAAQPCRAAGQGRAPPGRCADRAGALRAQAEQAASIAPIASGKTPSAPSRGRHRCPLPLRNPDEVRQALSSSFGSGSTFSTASERLSPVPRARRRASSTRICTAIRGGCVASTPPISSGLK